MDSVWAAAASASAAAAAVAGCWMQPFVQEGCGTYFDPAVPSSPSLGNTQAPILRLVHRSSQLWAPQAIALEPASRARFTTQKDVAMALNAPFATCVPQVKRSGGKGRREPSTEKCDVWGSCQ